MFEVSTNTQIGMGLTVMGMVFLALGMLLLFDKGLLAIGNLMFLAGLTFIMGFRKVLSFFFRLERLKGSVAFFIGILILLLGHPLIGVAIELVGFYLLFKSYVPTVMQYIPFMSTVSRSVV